MCVDTPGISSTSVLKPRRTPTSSRGERSNVPAGKTRTVTVPELRPGIFNAMMAQLTTQAMARGAAALETVALAIEKQAKINASNGQHPYGTRTPASPGTGPARISGTLVRSITHSPVERSERGWMTRVGLAGGLYPHYQYGRRGNRRSHGRRSETPSSRYGKYLETGLRNGSTYPFLGPAVEFGRHIVAPVAFREAFAGPWTLL